MSARAKLSSLKRDLRPRGVAIVYRITNGREELSFVGPGAFGPKVLFTADPNDLFDKDGNRFENDLALKGADA